MTFAKTSALGACLAGAVALGIWVSPYVRERGTAVDTHINAPAETVAPATIVESPAPVAETPAPRPAPARAAVKKAALPRTNAARVMGFSPDVHKRLKSVLNQGADIAVAADGFRDAEQFAMVAHASRNTQVPFMVLKHRVLTEGMTLPAAILSSKPDVNAEAEANRARQEARIDLTVESQDARNRE